MPNNNSRIAFTLTTVAFAASLAFSVNSRQPQAAADNASNNAQVKSMFEEKCSACHDAPDPEEKGYTKAQWQATVDRMLNTHGARSSISDDQAAQIVDYLGQFAPLPGGGGTPNEIGVWENDPAVSVSYPFTYPPNLQNFDIFGGAWKIVETSDTYSGYLKHVSTSDNPSILIENKNNLQGGIDLSVQFHVNSSNTASTVGLIFGAADARNYLEAVYTPSTGVVALSKVTDGQAQQLQQATVDSTQGSLPAGWHILRVKVTEGGGQLGVLMDYANLFKTTYPDWQGGRVGLVTTGPIVAGFRQMTIDSYQSSLASPAGDVLLH